MRAYSAGDEVTARIDIEVDRGEIKKGTDGTVVFDSDKDADMMWVSFEGDSRRRRFVLKEDVKAS